MSKLIEELYKILATGCGAYMEASHLSEILAHIERLEANQIPDGSVAVPREPTYEMMRAGCPIEGSCERSGDCHGDCHCNSTLRDIYRAMIQVATYGEGE